MTFKIFYVLRSYLLISYVFLQDDLRQGILCSFNVVVNHSVEERASNTHRDVQFGQLILCVFLCCQIAEVHDLENMLA